MMRGTGDMVDRSRRGMLLGVGGVALAAALTSPARAVGVARRAGLDPVLADLHRRTFDFFWATSNPANGLAPDNWPDPKFCSIAATGFALTANCIGAASGYVPRAAAAARTLTTLRTFWNGPQGDATGGVIGHHGFFYHFLHMDSALRYGNVELSSIDTSLFLMGALSAAAYFDGADPAEAEIRRLGIALYERVDWTFMAHDNGLISMGWHPEPKLPGHDARGLLERNWDRYNEGMMVNLLALGSPTHPAPPRNWPAWIASVDGTWGPNFGEPHLGFSPLFGHQYSHCWYDFRGIADAYMRRRGSDYFINSHRATVAQRNYAIRNPGGFRDYGGDVWGLTACRGPGDVSATLHGRAIEFRGYGARGPQTGDGESFDDGTIAPTAGVSSVAFAPEICVPLIHQLRRRYGHDIYGRYGFTDAFNPSFPRALTPPEGGVRRRAGWVAETYLGIDQGPILALLENHRSGLIWDRVCRGATTGPIIKRGLKTAGFTAVAPAGAWLET